MTAAVHAASSRRGRSGGGRCPSGRGADGRRAPRGRQGSTLGEAVAPVPSGVPPADGELRAAAFFDLDKTVISKASMVAFSRPLHRAGLLSRRLMLRAAWGQLVYAQVGAVTREAREAARARCCRSRRAGTSREITAIVRETLEDVIEPIVFDEASAASASTRPWGHKVFIVSAVTGGGRGARSRSSSAWTRRSPPAPSSTTTAATPAAPSATSTARRRRSRSSRSPRATGSTSGVVGLLRLGHRHPDARRGRPPGRGEPRPRAGQGGQGAGLADRALHARGAAARPGAGAGAQAGRGGWRRGVLGAAAVAGWLWWRRNGPGACPPRRVRPRGPSWRRRRPG